MFGNVAYSQAPYDSFAGTTYTVSVSELVTAQDTQATRGFLNSAIAELVGASDSVAARLPFAASVITEMVTATDSAVTTRVALRSRASDQVVAADAVTTNGALYALRSEQVTGTPLLTPKPNYVVRRQEDATATDRVSARGLWEPIPDTQDPNWVIIPTTPT